MLPSALISQPSHSTSFFHKTIIPKIHPACSSLAILSPSTIHLKVNNLPGSEKPTRISKSNYKNHSPISSPSKTSISSFSSSSSLSTSSLSVAASSSMAESQGIVDHLVYFQIKSNAEPEKVSDMLNSLFDLHTLNGVISLNVGTSIDTHSSRFNFTHALHSRYVNKAALDYYSQSPEHVKVVTQFVRPVAAALAAVDWEPSNLTPIPTLGSSGTSEPAPATIHTVMMQIKDTATKEELDAMVDALNDQVGKIPGLRRISVGENFSPARSKGYNWGFAAEFDHDGDFEAYRDHPLHLQVMGKVIPLVEDYTSLSFTTLKPSPTAKF